MIEKSFPLHKKGNDGDRSGKSGDHRELPNLSFRRDHPGQEQRDTGNAAENKRISGEMRIADRQVEAIDIRQNVRHPVMKKYKCDGDADDRRKREREKIRIENDGPAAL